MMRNFKPVLFLVSLALLLITLPGCWNYRELNTMSIVTGFAVDKNDSGQYVLTVEVLQPKSQGRETQLEPVLIGVEGESIFDAIRTLWTRTGRRLYWAHAKVFVISEEVAKEGITPVIDLMYRDKEIRGDLSLVISREATARDILQAKSMLEQSVSFQIDDTLSTQANIGKFIEIELWKFVRSLMREGQSPVLPTVNTIKYGDQIIPQVYGTAVFRGDKMVGWLDGDSSKMALLAMGLESNNIIMKSHAVGKEKGNSEEKGTVIYEVLGSQTEVTPRIKNDQLQMEIKIELNAQLAELNDASPRYYDEKVIEMLEAELAGHVEERVYRVIRAVQQEYRCDIFGFGSRIKREMPELWKKIREQWVDIFPDVNTVVTAKIRIAGTALLSKPIQMEE